MSRSWPGRPRQRYFRRPRSRWRKLADYGLTAAIFGLLFVVSARLDRVETRQRRRGGGHQRWRFDHARHRAHPVARHRCARIFADLPQRWRGLSLWPALPRGAVQARRWAPGDMHGLGAGPVRSPAWRMQRCGHQSQPGPGRGGLGGGLWRLRARRRRLRAANGSASGPANSTGRANGGGRMAMCWRSSTTSTGSIVNWLREILRFS